ncbi:MAG: hypothetical protein KDJ29_15390 [Hyphomicrobiales bacterium]|nr:hypothetical protein [Hyphomicrobiales bacterium]
MRPLYLTISALALAGIGSVSSVPAARASCVFDVASWDVLWIRNSPGVRSAKVGSIPANACGVRINFGNCQGHWCEVHYRGVSGWAHTRYLRD